LNLLMPVTGMKNNKKAYQNILGRAQRGFRYYKTPSRTVFKKI